MTRRARLKTSVFFSRWVLIVCIVVFTRSLNVHLKNKEETNNDAVNKTYINKNSEKWASREHALFQADFIQGWVKIVEEISICLSLISCFQLKWLKLNWRFFFQLGKFSKSSILSIFWWEISTFIEVHFMFFPKNSSVEFIIRFFLLLFIWKLIFFKQKFLNIILDIQGGILSNKIEIVFTSMGL